MELRRFAHFAALMRAQGHDRAHHEFAYNQVRPHLLILADSPPTELVLYRPGVNAGVFLTVRPTFRVNTFMGEQLDALREVLSVGRTQDGEFKPSEFFAHLDGVVPLRFRPYEHRCAPAHAIYRCRDVEEADKIYFRGIQHHSRASGRRPTPQNLDKTRQLLGAAFAQRCDARRISTCWTDDPTQARTPAAFPALRD